MEKIIFAVITALVGVLIWCLKAQTNCQNKRDVRDNIMHSIDVYV